MRRGKEINILLTLSEVTRTLTGTFAIQLKKGDEKRTM